MNLEPNSASAFASRICLTSPGATLQFSRTQRREEDCPGLVGEVGRAYHLVLQADDGLATEAALAQLFEHLARTVELKGGADLGGDRPCESMSATSFSPCGDDKGFVIDEMCRAVTWRSANHASSRRRAWRRGCRRA